MLRWFIFLPISLLLSNLGCAPENSPGQKAPSSQDTQFEITDLLLYEGPVENMTWQAVAKTATGDLQNTVVTGVRVTHHLEKSSHTVILNAPRGTLSPRTHDAFLQEATVEDSFERRMKIPSLTYRRKLETIGGSGPIEIDGPGYSLSASKLEYQLKNGSLLLSGPVEGTVSMSAKRPRSERSRSEAP